MQWFVDNLAVIASILLSLVALYKALKTTPHEIISSDASTAAKFEEAAGKAIERALRMEERLNEVETRLDNAQKVIDQQAQVIEVLRKENIELKGWAERLVHQVQSLGADPVKMR